MEFQASAINWKSDFALSGILSEGREMPGIWHLRKDATTATATMPVIPRVNHQRFLFWVSIFEIIFSTTRVA
jgi:hypothetical protein